MSSYINITTESFDSGILESKGILLADFWAEWCGPCRAFAPSFAKISEDFSGKLQFAKVNVEEVPEATEQLGIAGIPAAIFFKDGKEISRIVGAVSKQELEKQINEVLKAA